MHKPGRYVAEAAGQQAPVVIFDRKIGEGSPCVNGEPHKCPKSRRSRREDMYWKVNRFSTGLIIQALANCRYAKVTDAFLELVVKSTKGAKYFDYDLQLLFASAKYLPAADLSKLDAFAALLEAEQWNQHQIDHPGLTRELLARTCTVTVKERKKYVTVDVGTSAQQVDRSRAGDRRQHGDREQRSGAAVRNDNQRHARDEFERRQGKRGRCD